MNEYLVEFTIGKNKKTSVRINADSVEKARQKFIGRFGSNKIEMKTPRLV